MSQLPSLHAPDGFEMGVFVRTSLAELPSALAPPSFEDVVLQKAAPSGNSGANPRGTIKPTRRIGIGWKTTVASLCLLATVGSVSLVTGKWDLMGLSGAPDLTTTSTTRTQPVTQPLPTPSNSTATPETTTVKAKARPTPTDLRKADNATKRKVVKSGKGAINNATINRPVTTGR